MSRPFLHTALLRSLTVGFVVGVALFVSPAYASEASDGCVPAGRGVLPASACPALFGDPLLEQENRQRRESLLESIRVWEHSIDVVYHGPWEEPQPLDYRGIKLLQTFAGDSCEATAVLEVTDEAGELGCAAGDYAVTRDASVGREGRILAVLDEVVLLEQDGELGYLAVEGQEPPLFRMVWHPRWTLRHPYKIAPVRPSRAPHRPPGRRR